MRTYKLEPLAGKENSQYWRTSRIKAEPVWVKASSVGEARNKVALCALQGLVRKAGRNTLYNPYHFGDMTSCIEDQPDFDVPEGIIILSNGERLTV